MLADVKISGKLLLGFGAVLLILVSGSAFNILSANAVRKEVIHVREVRYANAIDLLHLINLSENVLAGFTSAADSASLLPVEEAKKIDAAFQRELTRIREETALDPDLDVLLEDLLATYRKCAELGMETARLSVEQDFLGMLPVKQEYTKAVASYKEGAAQLRGAASLALSRTLGEIEVLSRNNVRSSLALAALGFLLGGGMALLISRNITAPFAALVAVIEEFGRGNLAVRLNLRRKDEIGQVGRSVDEMAERLQGLITRVNGTSAETREISRRISQAGELVDRSAGLQAKGVGEVSAAIDAIDASVEKISQGVEGVAMSGNESSASILEMSASIEQVAVGAERLSETVEGVGISIVQMALAIDEVSESTGVLKDSYEVTAASIAQMDGSIKEVEEKARDTAVISNAVRRDAEEGKAAVAATATGMQEIKRATQLSSSVIQVLAAKASEIGSILSVIDEVTEQTNLLALNAAIIAAQAGDHGRGFAVVAGEIRDLADRTATSTREIAGVIRGIQEETAKAVQAIRDAERKIGDGEAFSRRSDDLLGLIVAGAEKAAAAMDQIARTTVEQAQDSRTISSSIGQVATMIDQIARAISEQSKGSELIRESAERMKDLTMQVKSSTREQSRASRVIVQSMEDIRDRLHKIREACKIQKEQSGEIVQAVGGIRGSAEAHLETTRILRESAEYLALQMDFLQREMGTFRLPEEEPEFSLG